MTFLISFSIVYIVNDWHRMQTDAAKREFYLKTQNPNLETLFVFGSSHVNVVNKQYVYKYVEEHDNEEFVVHFASKGNDSPLKRLDDLDRILSYDPSIVVYGINLRDFQQTSKITHPVIQQSTQQQNILPDPKNLIDKYFSFDNIFWIDLQNFANPKLTTLSIIKEKIENPLDQIFKEPISLEEQEKIIELNEQKAKKRQETIAHHNEIATPDKLKEHAIWLSRNSFNIHEDNPNTLAFIEVIRILKENNVKIILFTTPIYKEAWDRFSESDKESFFSIIDKISKDYDIEIYYFHNKYWNENIWMDSQHITLDPKGLIYSEDISKLIVNSTG